MIRPATENDAASIARIYNHYILNTIVTFEEWAVSPEEIASRIRNVLTASLPYFVAVQDGRVIGYTYAAKWHDRIGYRFSVETTVYLDPSCAGKGYGSPLLAMLLDELKRRSMHLAVGCIALPNESSVALHEKFGFVKAAHFNEAGTKFGQWIDVGYWQRLL